MKLKIFSLIWALIVAVTATTVVLQSCAKDDPTTVAAATKSPINTAGEGRGTYYFWDDVIPPVTENGHTLTKIYTANFGTNWDSLYIVSAGILSCNQLVYHNVCSVSRDSLALGFVQNDSFRMKAPANWITCIGGQVTGQVWDANIEY